MKSYPDAINFNVIALGYVQAELEPNNQILILHNGYFVIHFFSVLHFDLRIPVETLWRLRHYVNRPFNILSSAKLDCFLKFTDGLCLNFVLTMLIST